MIKSDYIDIDLCEPTNHLLGMLLVVTSQTGAMPMSARFDETGVTIKKYYFLSIIQTGNVINTTQ